MFSGRNRRKLSLRSLMLLSGGATLFILFLIFHVVHIFSGAQSSGVDTPPPPPLFLPLAVLAGGLVSVLGSMLLLLHYLRSQARKAEDVLAALRKGELSARLPTEVFADLGGLTSKFNEMAGEIENLVVRLRSTEKSRIEMIQDIGHDLRHPLSSIRILSETLEKKATVLSPEKTREIRRLLHKETLSIEDMLEDLLTLATLNDPKVTQEIESFDLSDEIGDLMNDFKILDPSKEFRWEIFGHGVAGIRLRTDKKLFFRMLRNGVENARRFAKSKVTMSFGSVGVEGEVLVEIVDDGAGFSTGALEWFERTERHAAVPAHGSGRGAGLGLGSFVMRKIATTLGASLEVDNLVQQGQVQGGRLRIRL